MLPLLQVIGAAISAKGQGDDSNGLGAFHNKSTDYSQFDLESLMNLAMIYAANSAKNKQKGVQVAKTMQSAGTNSNVNVGSGESPSPLMGMSSETMSSAATDGKGGNSLLGILSSLFK
jgi:hypothetical protein